MKSWQEIRVKMNLMSERHRDRSKACLASGDLSDSEWHLRQAKRLEHLAYIKAQSPSALMGPELPLGSPSQQQLDETTRVLRTALIADGLGLADWERWIHGED